MQRVFSIFVSRICKVTYPLCCATVPVCFLSLLPKPVFLRSAGDIVAKKATSPFVSSPSASALTWASPLLPRKTAQSSGKRCQVQKSGPRQVSKKEDMI